MKMRQSLSQLEEAFLEETTLERHRRESLRRTAQRRTAKRRSERAIREGKSRFWVLSLTLLLTAAIVAVVMFRVLYLILE
jgi:Flp pilus assembly protein TadB